jgi:hypothetical protein
VTTGRELVTQAMKEAGVLTGGETPTSEEVVDALGSLNRMLASWANNSLYIYARTFENFPLSSGVGDYTIGPGGDFNTIRPMHIIDAYVRQDTLDYWLSVIPDEEYDAIAYKDIDSIPQVLNYTAQFPQATIRIYPKPQASFTLYLRSEKQLATITLNDEISLPPGWEDALVYNLAVRLGPSYGLPADPVLVELASQSRMALENNTSRNRSYDYTPARYSGCIYDGWIGWGN